MNSEAQARLSALRDIDEKLRFDYFDHEDAIAVGSHIIACAREQGVAVAVSVWLGEQLVFHCALPGTSADNDRWLERKSAVVRRYDMSSLSMRARTALIDHASAHAALGLDAASYALAGGAMPIRIRATQVGVVAVSGLSDEEDHALAAEALEHHLLDGQGRQDP